ncbi:MAG: hypothetical protein ACRD0K_22290 [Egibacteraceae bacterium]
MSTPPAIRRRHVLHAAVAIGVTTWLGRLLTPWPLSRNGRQPDGVRLVRLLTRTDSARAIGEAYLQSAPDEADPALLTSLLTAHLADGHRALGAATDGPRVLGAATDGPRALGAATDGPRVLGAATDGHLRQWLLGSTRRDFADGLIVTLDGWVLSRTEARLCALAALI